MVDTKLRIWDNMILNNRKDTYDRPNGRLNEGSRSVRRGSNSGDTGAFEANRSRNTGKVLEGYVQRSRCEAHPATGEKRKAAAHDSEARRKDQRSGNPGQRPSRIYPGIQARAGEAGGRQRAQQRHHPRAERGHRRPQVPAGDANHLRTGGRLMDRGLRAPSPFQAPRSKQASRSDQASSGKRQASSFKPQAARSVIASPG